MEEEAVKYESYAAVVVDPLLLVIWEAYEERATLQECVSLWVMRQEMSCLNVLTKVFQGR